MLYDTNFESFDHVDINDIDVDAVDEEAATSIKSLTLLSEEEQLKEWRSQGLLGKAHSFVVYVNRSP